MYHRKSLRKLNRSSAHRRALFRNLATALILKERLETTLPKAKELRRIVDKLVTLAKKNTLHARRQALTFLTPVNRVAPGKAMKREAMHRLFEEIAPRFDKRPGGYTRVLRGRLKPSGKRLDSRRPGDNALMAIIEFVEGEVATKTKKKRRLVKREVSPVVTPAEGENKGKAQAEMSDESTA